MIGSIAAVLIGIGLILLLLQILGMNTMLKEEAQRRQMRKNNKSR